MAAGVAAARLDDGTGRVYRTFWRRFWAGMIDGLVFAPLSWIGPVVWASTTQPAMLASWFVFHSFSLVTYSIILHGLFGQTLGKRITGVTVLDVGGARLSMRQAVLRDSVYVLLILYSVIVDLPGVLSGVNPYVVNPEAFRLSDLGLASLLSLYASLLWFVLEMATMLSNRRRRAVHDFLAGSLVVITARSGTATSVQC
jgi:uncharacterized RDD family membrane protein YckC